MISSRRKVSWLTATQAFLWPKKGWTRMAKYMVLKTQRIRDTPHRLALGASCGVLASFSPLFGLHFVMAGLLAWAIRGNIIASMFGTGFGNPLTFPLIAAASIGVGSHVTGQEIDMAMFWAQSEAPFLALWALMVGGEGPALGAALSDFFYNIFAPYMIGGAIPGLICSVVVYIVLRRMFRHGQKLRLERRAARKARKAAQAAA